MVEEIVNNILEAEDRADQIVQEAKEEAKRLIVSAQKKSEETRAACVQECRALAEEGHKAAVEAGQAEYDRILSAGKEEAEAKSECYRKQTDEGVKAVLSAILA